MSIQERLVGVATARSARRTGDVTCDGSAELWDGVAERARHDGEVLSGHHHTNVVVRLTGSEAAVLGRRSGSGIVARSRKPDAAPVVIRTWSDEQGVLEVVGGRLDRVPRFLGRREDVVFHSHLAGKSLSGICQDGKPVDSLWVEAFCRFFVDMARVPAEELPPRPEYWSRDGDSRGFLRTLLIQAEEQIRKPNWAAFGGLFVALGVPQDALQLRLRQVPTLRPRPFSLLHGDLHRDNVLVTNDGAPTLTCLDWELATYGDPLHDLAVHLVRMRYPEDQWSEVVACWRDAMRQVRPKAVEALEEDLQHYIDFEHAQSVYPDVIRAVDSLGTTFTRSDLEAVSREVRRALLAAKGPLGLGDVLDVPAIERLIHRWCKGRGARRGGDGVVSGVLNWTRDTRVPLRESFPDSAVEAALWAEGAVSARQVYKGASHLGTVVRVAGREPVMVRRKFDAPRPIEPRFLEEHRVLRAIEDSGAAVCVPRVLALGTSDFEDQFTIHSYEGPPNADRGPRHPVHGLLPGEVYALVDQLRQLALIDVESLAQNMNGRAFFDWLCDQLVDMVRQLSCATQHLAKTLGLPDHAELSCRLARHKVTPRRPSLLHGDLNPWNLVRRTPGFGLTLIDWEMAMVGDPLYDLVRHIHLTPTTREIRERMFARWERVMPENCTQGWARDVSVYRGLELVRSAYVDLDRMVTGSGLDTPNVRRAVGSYTTTLRKALEWLQVPLETSMGANPYIALAPPHAYAG